MGCASPDQATALIIDHVGVRVEEFLLEGLQVVVVQLELEPECPVRHPPSTLEHSDRLVENLLEGHRRPSTALALVPRQSNVRHGGVSRESAWRVYQESGGGAGESTRRRRPPDIGAI